MGYDLTSMLDYNKLKAKKPGGLGGLFAGKKIRILTLKKQKGLSYV